MIIPGCGEPATRVVSDANSLKKTIVTANLEHEHQAGVSLMWCTTMQLAWNEFTDFLTKPADLSGNPPLAKALNAKLTTKDDLDDASYVAHGGARKTIVPVIQAELAKKFREGADAKLLESPNAENRDDLFFYAYLQKLLKFKIPFDGPKSSLNFDGAQVKCFGESKNSHGDAAEQVSVWYKSDDDFVLELQTEAKDERMFLAKIQPGHTLLDTAKAVLQRVANPRDDGVQHEERLEIPLMDFDVYKRYEELIGKSVLNYSKGEYSISEARQRIKFQLNERGAKLISEAAVAAEKKAKADNVRRFIFDKPYLVMLIRKDAKLPYFLFWVANSELLVPAKP